MALFACTVFVSAALMFLVEPMVARMVLPVAGGAPMVWNTCIVFFQMVLLAGYWYARVLTARTDWRRLAVHAIVLLVPLAFLPLSIRGAPAPASNPAPWLLGVMTATVGPTFFVLATTTSLFQKWFADTGRRGARDPYVLYAFSNLGSVLALLSYPVLVEPALALATQARWWTTAYAGFVVLALASMALLWWRVGSGDAAAAPAASTAAAPVSWRQRGWWTLLAFAPSSLMLGVTTYLATDVASVPLLWVIPLALYLTTFVVAFSGWGDEARGLAAGALPLLVLPLVLVLVSALVLPFYLAAALHLLVFTVMALNCHGELAADRPPPAHLPDFYLWVAVGGVAGGLFNSLVAPLVFSSIAEYPIALTVACALFRPGRSRPTFQPAWRDLAVPAAVGALTAGILMVNGRLSTGPRTVLVVLGAGALLAFSQSRRPLRFALSVGAMLVAAAAVRAVRIDSLHRERTFFGVYRVEVTEDGIHHSLFHGTTLHGMQATDPARQSEPLTYYTRTGPFGVAFSKLPNLTPASRVAVVGLGAGTLAAYATGDQRWTFYEIDPAVERIARMPAFFTYLDRCGSQCTVVIGDARLSLARDTGPAYDLIALDAFSSDAIPLHLLTREALRVYLTRLTANGVLAFHLSNRHLTLGPVLTRLGDSEGLAVRNWFDPSDGVSREHFPSVWLLMARREADLGAILYDQRWKVPRVSPSTPLWTDDFTNIWSVLNRR